MVGAFALPALPSRSFTRPASSACARRPARMAVTVLRPSFKNPSAEDEPSTTSNPVYTPEVASIAATVCEFMNREHVRDIANYVVHFGRKFVKMTNLDAAGFTTDIVSCDGAECVCVQERFDWPHGLCSSAGDIINALKHLSMACGLPGDF